MTIFTETVSRVEAATAAYQETIKTALDSLLKALAESDDISLIAVIGSTPGFNDGEPCTHSADYYVNGDIVEAVSQVPELFEVAGIEIDDPHEVTTELERLGFQMADPANDKELYRAIDAAVIPALDQEFGTNYAVLYVFRDGMYSRYHTDYDCGY